MRYAFFLVWIFISTSDVLGQKILKNDLPRFKYEVNPEDGKDYLALTFGVSMSDCIKTVQVRNLANNHVYLLHPKLDNYHLRDSEDEEIIYAKLNIGRFNKMVKRKDGFKGEVTIISKTGHKVYHGISVFVVEGLSDHMDETTTAQQ